jgi:hypothetical protein
MVDDIDTDKFVLVMNSYTNNSVKFFIVYVSSQELQGQVHKQHSVNPFNYITDKRKHTDDNRLSLRSSTLEELLFLPYKNNINK